MGNLGIYLRTYRRRWQLTEGELAFLFGYATASMIGRLEREERVVTLANAHACQVIFGVEPNEIFPALFGSIEEDAINRMHELRDRLLQRKPTERTLAKLELLDEALSRTASGR